VSHEDIRPGLRAIALRRVLIASSVDNPFEERGRATIVWVFYGGQDYETILADDDLR
jgi:plasmid stabilization system protein ParE